MYVGPGFEEAERQVEEDRELEKQIQPGPKVLEFARHRFVDLPPDDSEKLVTREYPPNEYD
jgi:hypothetical protein